MKPIQQAVEGPEFLSETGHRYEQVLLSKAKGTDEKRVTTNEQ